jgi:hypothetical protein
MTLIALTSLMDFWRKTFGEKLFGFVAWSENFAAELQTVFGQA